MIWRRLKKSTPEQDAEFQERMTEAKLTFKDKLAIVLSAYLVLLLPALAVLLGICTLAMWLLGII